MLSRDNAPEIEQLSENKRLVQRYFEEINRGNLEVLDDLCAPDIIHHTTHSAAPLTGLKAVKRLASAYQKAFPDLHYTLDTIVAEGPYVTIRWKASGTHRGTFQGIPPTGKVCAMSGMSINRLQDGQIAERWIVNDDLGILQEMGLRRGLLAGAVGLSLALPAALYRFRLWRTGQRR